MTRLLRVIVGSLAALTKARLCHLPFKIHAAPLYHNMPGEERSVFTPSGGWSYGRVVVLAGWT